MNKVIFDTIKMTVAAMFATYLAMYLKLDFYLAAGIVTVLTIQTTKRETMKTAGTRFIAFLIAIVFAFVSFKLLGVSVPGFGLYLLLYLMVCYKMKWYSSMAMNSVLVTHFISFGELSVPTVMNEMLLFIIGVGFGILANLHLHQDDQMFAKLKERTDNQIRHILKRMSQRILNEVDEYDGLCFDVLNDLITQAKIVARENEANVILFKNDDDARYIRMRERQSQILYEMFKIIRKMKTTPFTAEVISKFIEQISEEYSAENNCENLLARFYEINGQMKTVPLPIVREEFEDRARLFAFLKLTEEFLNIKKEYMEIK